MLAYPIFLEDDDDTVLATSPDFPELTTFGDDREEAIAHAVDALEEAIAARIHYGEDIPPPSQGANATYAVLPTLTTIKVMLYQEMRAQGLGNAELARRLGWQQPQVDNVLDIQRKTPLDRIDTVIGAMWQRMYVDAATEEHSSIRVPTDVHRGRFFFFGFGSGRRFVETPEEHSAIRVPAAASQPRSRSRRPHVVRRRRRHP